MFLEISSVIHPNAIKHSAELLGESLLPSDVIKKLRDLNFKDQPNGFSLLKEFLDENVSDSVKEELLRKVNSYIYSIDGVENIISDYVDTRIVTDAIVKHLRKENNNGNYTFDYLAILNDFKSKILSYYSAYDFDSNGLFKSLINSFTSFYCKQNASFIYSIFNEKGNLVTTDEGSVLLESLASVSDDSRKVKINFSKVVKDIYEASKDLFSINKEIHYDIFTHYLKTEMNSLHDSISSLIKKGFSVHSLGPRVNLEIDSFGSVPYRVKTLRRREEILELFLVNVKNGLDLDSIQELYRRIERSDSLITDTNVGKLFEHKDTPKSSRSANKVKKSNYNKFFDILQGVISLNELVSYLHETGNRLTSDDCIIFRDSSFYKRFDSFENYLLLKDVTKDLIKETTNVDADGNPIDRFDNVPFMTNDECFDHLLKNVSYNFTSLRDFVNSNLRVNTSEFNVTTAVNNLTELQRRFYAIYVKLDEAYEYLSKQPGMNDLAPQGFEFKEQRELIFNTIIGFSGISPEVVKRSLFCFSPEVNAQALMESDITLFLRYLNFSINIFQHLKEMLSKSASSVEYSLLNIDRTHLYLPSSISTFSDVIKFKCSIPMKFYLTGNRTTNDISLKKHYYLTYDDIRRGLKPYFEHLENWKRGIEEKAKDLHITFSVETLNQKLKEIAILINSKEDNCSEQLKVFMREFQNIGGFLYLNGALYRHRKGYIHERGYFVNPSLGYMIDPIKSDDNLNDFVR